MGTLCSKPRLRNPAGVSSQVAWEFLTWSELWFSPKSSVFPCVFPFFFPQKTLSVFNTWPHPCGRPPKKMEKLTWKIWQRHHLCISFGHPGNSVLSIWGVAITCSNYISWISFGCSELGKMLLVDERMAAWGLNPGNQTVMTSNFCLKRVPPCPPFIVGQR